MYANRIPNYSMEKGIEHDVVRLVLCNCGYGQVLVRGTVVDQTGESVIGASIQVKGTTQGTITDIDGKFSLGVPDKKSVIVVSFIAMPQKNCRWIPLSRCLSYWKKIRRYWMK